MLYRLATWLMGVSLMGLCGSAFAAPIQVTVVDAISGATQAGVRVDAVEVQPDGGLQWRSRQDTDANGTAHFELAELGTGTQYAFKTRPAGRSWVTSSPVSNGPTFRFEIGQLPVTLTHPASGEPLPEWTVTLRERLPDGSDRWIRRTDTDASGQARFDATGLGGGRQYFLQANSPIDNKRRNSATISQKGAFNFQVGNTPLVVTAIDLATKTPLPDLKIYAEKETADGYRHARTVTTDADGQALLSLEGLGSDQRYRLKTRPWSQTLYSPPLNTTGPFNFSLGTTFATLTSGADGSLLIGVDVDAYEILDDGKRQWRARAETDSAGIARMNLGGLGTRTYQLRARSTVDGSKRYSQPITEYGAVDFVVGNTPLNVTVKDHFTGATLADVEVTVRERKADGGSRWVKAQSTDANGQVVFDLEGLGDGRDYYLQAKPYNNGRAQSADLSATGDFDFTVGRLPVTLINAADQQALSGKWLHVYEKTADGRLHWRAKGQTAANGTVRLDPAALGTPGRFFLVKASNPFGEEKSYYSELITAPTEYQFAVSAGDRNYPDRKLPQIQVITPQAGQSVSDQGIRVLGVARDNVAVDSVAIQMQNADGTPTALPATLHADSGYFEATVAAELLTAGQATTLQIVATDSSFNAAVTELAVNPIADTSAPAVVIDLPQDGGAAYQSGFLVSGQVDDNTQIDQLSARLTRDGQTLLNRPLDWSYHSDRWTLVVPADTVPTGAEVSVLISARDMGGNRRSASITLIEADEPIDSLQLARRASFGPTPTLLGEIRAQGPMTWLSHQLNPNGIDDSALDALLAELNAPTSTSRLQEWTLAHMLYSRAQLRELMTFFWDNHFNTNKDAHGRTQYELDENQAFRANALGYFRDLLGISAKSPAMLLYLDNARSRKEEPNENYPRELLELHTLGVNGGYTDEDVVEIARALTGWTVKRRAFVFEPRYHDEGEKTVLGHIIPAGGGIEDGEQVLDIVAAHPATANYICTKLITFFVTENPTAASVAACAAVFERTDGHIASVVSHTLRSAAFSDPANFQLKAKSPLEQVLALVRATDATPSLRQLRYQLEDMGMPLYRNPVPTGYAETGSKWINSQQVQERVQFANAVAFNPARNHRTHLVDPLSAVVASGHHTAEGITGYLGQLALGNDWSDLEWSTARGLLRGPGDPPFDIGNVELADEMLRAQIGTVFSLPSAQLH